MWGRNDALNHGNWPVIEICTARMGTVSIADKQEGETMICDFSGVSWQLDGSFEDHAIADDKSIQGI